MSLEKPADAAPPLLLAEQPSEGYRRYVLFLLFSIYLCNFLDRSILTVLVQPIKEEYALNDTQVGLLGGLAFALLYCTLGIPIARWADRGNRVSIISLSLAIWSAATACMGLARSFTQLLFCRVVVGIGEAGCSPPAYSLISDYFEPKRRSTALAIYSLGISCGVSLGFLLGGQLARAYGWRSAFYLCGVPGLLLSVIVKRTLREPARGLSELGPRVAHEHAPVREVLARLWSKPAFRHLSLGAAVQSFIGHGIGSFNAAFLIRAHGLSVAQAGRALGLVALLGGSLGTYAGGWLADRMSERAGDRRMQLWVPAFATLCALPCAVLVYSLSSTTLALCLMVPSAALSAMHLAPTFSVAHSLVPARERALAGALLLFIVNLIGLGLGPLLTGALSDVFKSHMVAHGMSELAASASGLRYALSLLIWVKLWAAFQYRRAARTLREDAVS